MADAATSVLAIAALLVAMVSQWVWADPAVGIANLAVGKAKGAGIGPQLGGRQHAGRVLATLGIVAT